MHKIKTMFARDWNDPDHPITREIDPECSWVLANEGVPTKKGDGTAVMIEHGKMYKRYDRKKILKGTDAGKWKPEPAGWINCEIDDIAGHWWGWVPVDFSNPADKWYKEAWDALMPGTEMIADFPPPDGTYELCGPSVNVNPEGFGTHVLVPHGKDVLDFNFTGEKEPFDEVRDWLATRDIEGIVWWHPDGRKAKIKKVDFKLPRKTAKDND